MDFTEVKLKMDSEADCVETLKTRGRLIGCKKENCVLFMSARTSIEKTETNNQKYESPVETDELLTIPCLFSNEFVRPVVGLQQNNLF